jgi:CheY-like chemotaxis protein
MSKDDGNELNILMADDDADDRMFFSDAVSSLPLKINLTMVKDGAKLMDRLSDTDVVLPDILFLDLNMPFKNGFQCLTEIRGDRRLKEVFVIIYSTTSNPKEVDETFNQGANLFVHKPNTFSELKRILAKVFELDLKQYARPEKQKFVLDTY